MKQIRTFHITHLLQAAHYGFHKHVIAFIREAGVANLHLEALFPAYAEAVETQWNHLGDVNRLANTSKLDRADKIRDFYIRRLFKTVKDYRRCPIFDEKREAENIWRKISSYEGLATYERTKESALTMSLLDNIDTENDKIYLEKIGLSSVIENIRLYQNKYDEEVEKRLKEETKKVHLDRNKQRKIIDAHYRNIVTRINAFALVAPDDAVNSFIDKMNTCIHDYRRVLSHMRRGGSGNEAIKNEKN